jgi:hypothetical protein
MSNVYPNFGPAPASQFATGQQPNYAAPLMQFNQIPQALQQALLQRAQSGQAPGGMTAPSGPNSGGKAAPTPQPSAMQNFAASLRKFFPAPGGQQPGGVPPVNPAGFGGGGAQMPQPAPSGSMGFGGGGPQFLPPQLTGGAGF